MGFLKRTAPKRLRMNHNGNHIESRLWAAADELRANSKE